MPESIFTPLAPRGQLAQTLAHLCNRLLDVLLQQDALLDATDRHQLTRALDLLSQVMQRLVLGEAGHTYRFEADPCVACNESAPGHVPGCAEALRRTETPS